MLKVGLLCGVIAALSATGAKSNLHNEVAKKEIDAKFIVELEEDIDSISADEAIKQQDAIYKQIKKSVNSNVVKDQHFTVLTNSLVISGNKEDKEAISQIKGVKSVTENGTHVVENTMGSSISIDLKKGESKGSIDLSQNASAITMKKPETTNEGEGTLIAVLDNEFYLRGRHDGEASFNHKTYTALGSDVGVRLTASSMKKLVQGQKTYAQPNGAIAGSEGSLYFNNKVPFYYDYAGDSYNGSSHGAESDYNVYSEIGLHGSHVSSIAGGNDPDYKGIAPKAQMCLMKVFTDVHPTPFSEAAGSGKYSSFSEIGFINALEDCIKLKVDAINVSIGSDLSDFEADSITMRTLTRLSDSNILTSISAGNGGKSSFAFTGGYGNWTRDMVETGIMGSFANNPNVMTIASGQPEWTFYEDSFRIGDNVIPYEDQIVNREGETASYPDCEHKFIELLTGDIEVDPNDAQQEIEFPYIYVKGFGKDADYKNKDVDGKIVVVNRGSINFSEKYNNAANNGAIGLIIVNNDPTANDFNFRCDFGGELPSFPVALALFKDKAIFEANQEGTLKIKKNTSSDNKLKNTISDFSTDGCTYNLDLKPEITTPGSNIKGAVWPQNKKEKLEENKYCSYEYFNGTSMAAPNFEGAMSVVLSKTTKDIVSNGITDAEQKLLDEAKRTMDMRFMSTAIPMHDYEANDEDGKNTLTSPRMQGAGMANIEGAYKTDTYLEGMDVDGTHLNKAKILLRNNEDIANGKVKLSFIAHNTSSQARSYDVSFNVMRPAIANCNKVLTSDYGTPIEVDSVKNIPGFEFYSPEEEKIIKADGTANYKDTIKISKDILYFENEQQYLDDDPQGVVKEGIYYCSSTSGDIVWDVVPALQYQSVKDVEIAKVNAGTITVAANSDQVINLDTYELTSEAKDKIQELYENGTYIEGYVTLASKDEANYPDLGLPYLGFYSLQDRIAGHTFSDAPAVEPFSFEKDAKTIYASDLVNDVTKQLLGKDRVDYGSMMLAGYAKTIGDISIDRILTNDESFKDAKGFKEVGIVPDPYTNNMIENPKDNIYVGSPSKTNTIIVQQFVMRSISNNYFTIVNKATGQEVYRSALTDMLFGEQSGTYPLYKSHVDADYLGAGYVAHRAYSIIPLYDPITRKSFASGEYELKFNYQLASTEQWVSKAYTLHVDAEAPVVSEIYDCKVNGKDMVHVTYKDTRVAYAIFGFNRVDVKFDSETGTYYSEVDKNLIDSCLSSSRKTSYSNSRLYITVVDYARGQTTAIVHFTDSDYSHFEIAQGCELTTDCDFKYENGKLTVIQLDKYSKESVLDFHGEITLTDGSIVVGSSIKGCGGSIVGTSAIVSVASLAAAGLIFSKKRKEEEDE